MIRTKILNIILIFTSFIVYLEWGGGNSMFLIEGEIELISKLFTNPLSVLHPFTVLPLLGQILLLITLFQAQPSKILTYIGLGGIGVLVFFIFIIGLISFEYKFIISSLPFLITGVLIVLNQRKNK